jgi:6-pyruvoyltetrahydropterin/6-carboxytetrahydropterin synthase
MNSYIIIDGWKSNICFSSAHIIHEYEKCGRLHGHTYAIHAKLSGDIDNQGIIIDFSVVKNILRNIANHLDHKVLIPEKSKIAKIEKNKTESVKVTALEKTFVFPFNDCVFLPIASTSAENISKFILDYLLKNLDISSRINYIEIGIDEGYGQGARISKKIK